MNLAFLESALLLILSLNFLRTNFLTNQLALVFLALAYIAFLVLSFFGVKKRIFTKARFLLFSLIIIILYGLLILQKSGVPDVHDGAILTKAATAAFLSGQNPYQIIYNRAFENVGFKPQAVTYNSYMYSPLMFIANIPANLAIGSWYKGNEFVITLVGFFIAAGVTGVFAVREKLLFLILFLLNPVFVPLTFYGANEAIMLCFLIACMAALLYKKITLATILLALATGTKLLALPFVPLYFIYIYANNMRIPRLRSSQIARMNANRQIFKQVVIFLLVNLTMYLPFLAWGSKDLIEDVLFYHLRGGVESHIIAGFLGIPSLLSTLRVITVDSGFPFYIFQLMVALGALPFIYKIQLKFPSLTTLIMTFVIYFSAIFMFSRIMQSSYIAFLSQMILLAAFLGKPLSRSY